MRYDQAIRKLVPNAEYIIEGEEIDWILDETTGKWTSNNFKWLLTDIPKPTKEQIDQALTIADTEWTASEYQRIRALEYPAIRDQLDMLWHAIDSGTLDKSSDFYTAIKAVKDANPKT
jgi:hypothetical protein